MFKIVMIVIFITAVGYALTA